MCGELPGDELPTQDHPDEQQKDRCQTDYSPRSKPFGFTIYFRVGLAQQTLGDMFLLLCIGAQQGAVTDDVNDSWHPSAELVYDTQGSRHEDLPFQPDDIKPVPDIGQSFLPGQ